MTGYIRVPCDKCGTLLRVQATFPDSRSPFADFCTVCPKCHTRLLVTDPAREEVAP